MSYLITVKNQKTGDVLELPTATDNCLILYGDNKKHDNIKHLRLNEKTVIDNDLYRDLAKALTEKYELKHIPVSTIIFTIDEVWEPSEAATLNSKTPIDIKKVSGMAHDLTGWTYEIKLRHHYLEKWTEAQRNAAILSQLLRIHQDGYIIKPGEHFTSKLVATFGFGYLDDNKFIDDVLEKRVDLEHFGPPSAQISIEEQVKAAEQKETNVGE